MGLGGRSFPVVLPHPQQEGALMIRAQGGVFSFPSLRVTQFAALPPAVSGLFGRKVGTKTPRGA